MVNNTLKKYYLVISLTVGSIIVVFLFIYLILISGNSLWNNIKQTDAELKVKNEELDNLTTKLNILKSYVGKEDELREKAKIVSKALPTKREVGELFIQLDTLVEQNKGTTTGVTETKTVGVPTGEVSFEPSVIDGTSSAIYEFNATFSSYEDFKIFLEKSEKALRFITLKSFQKADPNSADPSFRVKLSYVSYYRSE
jgi:Tfp pilus assembly protein PilO